MNTGFVNQNTGSTASYANPQANAPAAYSGGSNADYVISLIPQILNDYYNRQVININEYNTIMRNFQDPNAQARIRTKVTNLYGNMQMAWNILQSQAESLVNQALQTLRNSYRPQPAYNGYGYPYGNGYNPNPYGYAAPPMSQPGLQFGNQPFGQPYGGVPYQQQSQSATSADIHAVYGVNAQQGAQPAVNPYPQPTQSATARATSPATPTAVGHAPAKVHTGKPYDIDLSFDDPFPDAPDWKECFKDMIAKPGAMTQMRQWVIEYEKNKVKTTESRLETPATSREGAITDLVAIDDSAVDDKFINIVSYDQMYLARMPYETSKRNVDRCVEALNKTKGIDGVHEALKIVAGSGTEFAQFFGGLILKYFNRAASVNFVKMVDGGKIRRLNPLISLAQLDQLLTDSGTSEFEEWKADSEHFSQALSNCLKASVGVIFRPKKRCYLDIRDPKDRALILADEHLGLRCSDGTCGRLVSVMEPNETRTKEIDDYLSRIFPVMIERKLILHNIDLPKIEAHDFGLNVLTGSTEALIMYRLFAMYGNTELVDLNDPTQTRTPLLIGVSYDNQLFLRRMDD